MKFSEWQQSNEESIKEDLGLISWAEMKLEEAGLILSIEDGMYLVKDPDGNLIPDSPLDLDELVAWIED